MTVRSLIALLLACLAVFGASFAAGRLVNSEEESAVARPAPSQPSAPEPVSRTLALDSAPGLPGLREKPKPKPKPKPAPAPAEPTEPAPTAEPAAEPSTVTPPPEPAPAPAPAPQPAPAPAPAPSGGESTPFYDGG
jgi:outer membrane biosynthesis protein TonB